MTSVGMARNVPYSVSIQNSCISNDLSFNLDTYLSSLGIRPCWVVIERVNSDVKQEHTSDVSVRSDEVKDNMKCDEIIHSEKSDGCEVLCEHCGASFATERDLARHSEVDCKRHSSFDSSDVIEKKTNETVGGSKEQDATAYNKTCDNVTPDPWTFLCELCATVFPREEDLKRHMQCGCPTSDGNACNSDGVKRELPRYEDWQRSFSPRDWQTRNNLAYPDSETKTKRNRNAKAEIVFSCEFCGKRFVTSRWCSNEWDHYLTYLQMQGVCSDCNVACLDYYIFNEDQCDFTCKRCGKSFKVVKFLKNHILQHVELAKLVIKTEQSACENLSSTSTASFPWAADGSDEHLPFVDYSQPPPTDAGTCDSEFLFAPFLADCEIKIEAEFSNPNFQDQKFLPASCVTDAPTVSGASEVTSVYGALSSYDSSTNFGRNFNLVPTVDELLEIARENIINSSCLQNRWTFNYGPSINAEKEFNSASIVKSEESVTASHGVQNSSTLNTDALMKIESEFDRAPTVELVVKQEIKETHSSFHQANLVSNSRWSDSSHPNHNSGMSSREMRSGSVPLERVKVKGARDGVITRKFERDLKGHDRYPCKERSAKNLTSLLANSGSGHLSDSSHNSNDTTEDAENTEDTDDNDIDDFDFSGRLRCKKCRKSFARRTDYRRHILTVHEKRYKAPVKKLKESSSFVCPHCGTLCRSKTWFEKHLRLHAEITEFVREKPKDNSPSTALTCLLCGEYFQHKNKFLEHSCHSAELETVVKHEKVKKFLLACMKPKVKPEETAVHACPLCRKRFKQGVDFVYHVRTHAEFAFAENLPDKPKFTFDSEETACLLCGESFEHKNEFQNHPCQKSEVESLVNDENVRNFLLTYTTRVRKPGESIVYVCPRCGKHYKRELAFVYHIRTHFELDSLVQEKNLRTPVENHEEPPSAVCLRCGESFENKTKLESHLKTHFLLGAVAANRSHLRRSSHRTHYLAEEADIECPRCGKCIKHCYFERHLLTHAKLDKLRSSRDSHS